MSGSDDRTGTSEGQEENKPQGETLPEIHRREMRMLAGVICRSDIVLIWGMSPNTVDSWEEHGLKAFRPGTREEMYLLSDVQEFLRKRETFRSRPEPKRRPSNGKKEKQDREEKA